MTKATIEQTLAAVAAALGEAGVNEHSAQAVARALVGAEADGLKGHGLSRLPSYLAQVRSGKIDPRAVPVVTRTATSILRIDAAHGFAYPALELAVEQLPAIARETGIAAAAIHRSHHCGAAGLVVERLADQGLASLLFANTPGAIAPWGGTTALFGTNPIAFGCPRVNGAPVVIDMSLSKVARGNILAAKQNGTPIPEGWALDAQGQPTTDPVAALAGTMLPLGDAKGTALALMVELLAAGLTGAQYATDASSFLDDKGGPPSTGQLIIVFDPQKLGGDGVLRHIEQLAAAIEAQEGARIPGSRRIASREKSAAEGIELPEMLKSPTV
ncbi:Ldh family oxidoreductase [Paracoccus laeviglucosivorans]|uniref:(2R)-3-sulfolactate dehydrogenase (NADP+) n=1 Tax=Paracoccus laeviglucosivorans TaxID=1197861 RepID=A0A521FN04_9RHOB|nr:Ldh family oxidoreductase [Paracoccus laeviglucosivorans]SMO97567.1 (2R)-3-sulfolactate dehydrogenase (NADP+) [Paracoccus laeviglucosivorans]